MKVWELIKALEEVTDKQKEIVLDEYSAKTVIDTDTGVVKILSKEPEGEQQLFP